MIGALVLALSVCADATTFTWRVEPAAPRVGDRVVLEAVLDPSPRGAAEVADPGLAPGLVDDGEFAWRREGGLLVLARAYVVAASGAVDLPRTAVKSGDAAWVASAARIDVTPVEPGRRGRVVLDPLQPIELPIASPRPSMLIAFACIAALAALILLLVSRRLRSNRSRGFDTVANVLPATRLRERFDELARRFEAGEDTAAAAATALRDVLRDAWAERSREPARARTSVELDALVRAIATADAAFCVEVFDDVEALCYSGRASIARDRVAAWLDAARAWLRPVAGAA